VNGIQYALRRVYDGENEITQDLLRLAAKYSTDHEIQHVTRDLASWSQEHVALLARYASDFGLSFDEEADTPHDVTERARQALSQAIGRRPEPGLLLLEDLRDLYLRASQNSLAWEMLAQVAQAKHQRELLNLTEQCHPQTLRQIRWANTMLKTLSPQVLASLS
jgi:hypothetical protein